MGKKFVVSLCIVVGSVLFLCGNEFTKPARTRKEKAQQEAVCDECLKLIDQVLESACHVQQQLGGLTVRLYKTLRSCAVEDKPGITQRDLATLRDLETTLKMLQKQLYAVETTLENEEVFRAITP